MKEPAPAVCAHGATTASHKHVKPEARRIKLRLLRGGVSAFACIERMPPQMSRRRQNHVPPRKGRSQRPC